jgi:hypothetical protein
MFNRIIAALAPLLGIPQPQLTETERAELAAYSADVKDAAANSDFPPPDPDRKGFIF